MQIAEREICGIAECNGRIAVTALGAPMLMARPVLSRQVFKDSQWMGRVMKMKKGSLLQIGALASLCACSPSWSADKETPSSVDVQKHAAAISNAISQASGVEQLVAAYHLRNNKFPNSNQEASVKSGSSLASPDIRSIDVQDNGVVVATLTETSGVDGGTVVFTPTVSQNTDEGLVDWKCTSPSFSTIADTTGGVCEYSKLP